jgi:hypothetical protein
LDALGVGLVSAALLLLSLGLINEISTGGLRPVTLLLLVAGTGLAVAFTLVTVLLRMSLVSSRVVVGGVVTLLGFFAGSGALVFTSIYLQSLNGMSAMGAALRLLPLAASFLLAAVVSAALASQFGARPPLVAGAVLIAASVFGLALAGTSLLTTGFVMACLAVLGIGLGLVSVAGAVLAIGDPQADLPGVAAGFQQTALALSGVLASAVIGSIASARASSAHNNPAEASSLASAHDFAVIITDAWQSALLVAGFAALLAVAVALLARPAPAR